MEDVLPKIEFGGDVLSDLGRAMGLEWIVANGLGAYASSTVVGINTRKYHGILVAALNPPVDRRVVLSKLDEQLLVEGEVYPLGANEFSHGINPQGYRNIKSFSQSPFPTFTYGAGRVELRKTILMPHQRNATVVFYEALSRPRQHCKSFPLLILDTFTQLLIKTGFDGVFLRGHLHRKQRLRQTLSPR